MEQALELELTAFVKTVEQRGTWIYPQEKGVHMARMRPPDTPEFRSDAVRLARSTGQRQSKIARDLCLVALRRSRAGSTRWLSMRTRPSV